MVKDAARSGEMREEICVVYSIVYHQNHLYPMIDTMYSIYDRIICTG